ncbi:hypothetical protein GCM10007857_89020 [Bradyrhizobium iriomotense]|uniref:Uncharacterized protein n=1 Tax=Bradyrhizobium iriomotense TaxID=441950 RepID=A0ABQ6BCX6_9BRAD|nr:hypothetical protein GCM10007857_89020 [Bradyrhizobium iriomotense]
MLAAFSKAWMGSCSAPRKRGVHTALVTSEEALRRLEVIPGEPRREKFELRGIDLWENERRSG